MIRDEVVEELVAAHAAALPWAALAAVLWVHKPTDAELAEARRRVQGAATPARAGEVDRDGA